MREHLPNLICLAGALQLLVPIASVLVPLRLNWREELHAIPRCRCGTWLCHLRAAQI